MDKQVVVISLHLLLFSPIWVTECLCKPNNFNDRILPSNNQIKKRIHQLVYSITIISLFTVIWLTQLSIYGCFHIIVYQMNPWPFLFVANILVMFYSSHMKLIFSALRRNDLRAVKQTNLANQVSCLVWITAREWELSVKKKRVHVCQTPKLTDHLRIVLKKIDFVFCCCFKILQHCKLTLGYVSQWKLKSPWYWNLDLSSTESGLGVFWKSILKP